MAKAKRRSSGALLPDRWAVRMVDADRIEAARTQLPADDELERVTGLFRLLGDPTRVRLLYALLEAGELCVCDLAATIDATETTVSQALRLLRTAGAVRARRAGRMIRYRLEDAHVRMVLDLSLEHLRHDEPEKR